MHKVVIKVGTNSITKKGQIDLDAIFKVARSVIMVYSLGMGPILVISGAVAAGMELCKIEKRPTDVKQLQYLSAIGARSLQNYLGAEFENHGAQVVYLPVTPHNFEIKEERDNLDSMINMAIANRDAAVINANDGATSAELVKIKGHPSGFYDNDFTALYTAKLIKARDLIFVTNTGNMGTGGGESKIKAIEEAKKAGIRVNVGGISILDDLETLLK